MRLGNDIVDLKIDARVHPRFLSRILHPTEKLLYPALRHPADIWRIWAAKEAAFKAHRQGTGCVNFLVPSRWLVDLQLNKVFFDDEEYRLSFEETDDYILATARSKDSPFTSKIFSSTRELDAKEQETESRSLREQLGLNQPIKDSAGVPRMTLNGQTTPYSLTHHGRHVAISHGL